jgi:dienelactone hydrolase
MTKKIILSLYLFLTFNLSSAEVSVKDFFKDNEFNSVKISPNGDYFATYMENKTTSRIVIIERSTNKIIYAHSFGENMFHGRYFWLNNERIGVAAAKRFGALANPRELGQFLSFNPDGSNKKMIIGDVSQKATRVSRSSVGRSYFEPIDMLLNDDEYYDKDNILVNFYEKSYPTLFKVNVYTGKKTKVSTSPAQRGGILLDKNKVARAAWGENTSNQNVFYYRDSAESDWELHGQYNYGQGTVTPISLSEDGQSIIVECSINKPTKGVCNYDPKTKKLTEIYRNSRVDIVGSTYQTDLAEPIAMIIYDGKPETIWLNKDARIGKKIRALEKTFPEYTVRIASSTLNEDELVIRVSNDRDPGGYYIFNTITNELKDLGMNSRGWINAKDMAKMEPISFKARDGLEINGYLTRPNNKKENLPMVMMVHGGPHGVRDYWRYDSEVQFLANRGYAVMQLNYRGSGGYGNDFLEAGFLKWGTTMQDDLTDGIKWAIKEGIADKEKLCIYGASYGGYAALMSSVREPDLYKCAIGYVGVYDVESFTSVGNIPNYRAGAAYLNQVIPEDAATRKAFSPSKQVNKIKANLFLIHGKMDRQAHYKNYEILTEALDGIGKEYKSMVKDKEEHGFVEEENKIELYEEMIKFLDENIGA